MPNEGKALAAARAVLTKALAVGAAAAAVAAVATRDWPWAGAVLGLDAVFMAFVFWFFRDPEARVPEGAGAILAPAHGLVDVIDEIDGPAPLPGRVRRISIFLSVFDVHVQQAPVSGKVIDLQRNAGKFVSALKTDCADYNENVWVAIRPDGRPDSPVGVRLIAGLIARRIRPWVASGDSILRGQRIALIQFGSRVELILPLEAGIAVRVGQRVVGGETVMAHWPQ